MQYICEEDFHGAGGVLFLKPIEFSFDAKSTTAAHDRDSMKQACFPYSVFNEKSGPGFFCYKVNTMPYLHKFLLKQQLQARTHKKPA